MQTLPALLSFVKTVNSYCQPLKDTACLEGNIQHLNNAYTGKEPRLNEHKPCLSNLEHKTEQLPDL